MDTLIRQTSFTLEELEELLSVQGVPTRPSGHCTGNYPAAMLLNEVGYIFLTEENKDAERILVDSLNFDDINAKFVAYCMLLHGFNLISEDTASRLEAFGQDPSNTDLVEASKRYFPEEASVH